MFVVRIPMNVPPYSTAFCLRKFKLTSQILCIRVKHHRMERCSFRKGSKCISASCNIPCMGGLYTICLTDILQSADSPCLFWPRKCVP